LLTGGIDRHTGSIFTLGCVSARVDCAIGAIALLTTIAETAAQLGLGCWTFAPVERTLQLDVINSPFAAGFGASPTPGRSAIKRVVRAVSDTEFAAETIAGETDCAATGNVTCWFEARVKFCNAAEKSNTIDREYNS
jgi:uncharacterized protein